MNDYSDDPYRADDYPTGDDVTGPAIPRITGIPHPRRSPESLTQRPPHQRDRRAE